MNIRAIPIILSVLTLVACFPGNTTGDTRSPASSQGAAMNRAVPSLEDGVTMKDGMMLTIAGGKLMRMEKDVQYKDGTVIKMDGTVILSDGTTLVLPEGMMITVEGRLQLRDRFGTAGTAALSVPQGGGSASSVAEVPVPARAAAYAQYTEDILTNGETKVLFFAASWCSECKASDAFLQSILPSSDYSRSVYKVDYEAFPELKVKYGVVYQHTFVVVDGNGMKLSLVQGPTDAQLRALLQ